MLAFLKHYLEPPAMLPNIIFPSCLSLLAIHSFGSFFLPISLQRFFPSPNQCSSNPCSSVQFSFWWGRGGTGQTKPELSSRWEERKTRSTHLNLRPVTHIKHIMQCLMIVLRAQYMLGFYFLLWWWLHYAHLYFMLSCVA